MNEEGNWKTKTLILGSLIGALTGLGMAILLLQRAEKRGERPKLDTSEGMKIGMALMGLLRQISKE